MSTYSTKDKDLLFEAYRSVKKTPNLLIENMPPTEPGSSWEDPIDPDKITPDTTKYMRQIQPEFRGKAAFIIATKIKEFLKTHAGTVFPGDFKTFRQSIADIIRKEFPQIDQANSIYTARKLQEWLTSNSIIKDERNNKLRAPKAAALIDPADIEARFKEALATSKSESPETKKVNAQKTEQPVVANTPVSTPPVSKINKKQNQSIQSVK